MDLIVFNSNQVSKDILNRFVYKNVVVLNIKIKPLHSHVMINNHIWPVQISNYVPEGKIYLNSTQRKLYKLAYNDIIKVILTNI